jgi:hypothetical protein
LGLAIAAIIFLILGAVVFVGVTSFLLVVRVSGFGLTALVLRSRLRIVVRVKFRGWSGKVACTLPIIV